MSRTQKFACKQVRDKLLAAGWETSPIAWYLGPEVRGAGAKVGESQWTGEWIEVAEVCNKDYGRFGPTTTRHQNLVHRALNEGGA